VPLFYHGMQKGQIFQRHGAWHLRYRVAGKQKSVRLAPFCDQYRTVKSVRGLADQILQPINEGQQPAGPQTLQQFVERTYLPYAKQHKRPSTYRGYINLYNAQIADRIGGMKLATFRTVDGQRLLDSIASETKLSHRSLIHVKSLLSGVFSFAKRMGSLDANPMVSTEIPKGPPNKKTHAYSLEEVKTMLATLKDTARLAVMVGAWTGLSLAELRGLQWGDIEENQLTVKRTVWHQIEGSPKTDARSNSVPLLSDVRAALKAHRKKNPTTLYVFEGPRQSPLDLATLGSKNIKPALEGTGVGWHGFHALRRGLGTRLFANGTPIETVSAILRHGSVHVTREHYVKTLPESSVTAMQALEKQSRKKSR
jgi:integrase